MSNISKKSGYDCLNSSCSKNECFVRKELISKIIDLEKKNERLKWEIEDYRKGMDYHRVERDNIIKERDIYKNAFLLGDQKYVEIAEKHILEFINGIKDSTIRKNYEKKYLKKRVIIEKKSKWCNK